MGGAQPNVEVVSIKPGRVLYQRFRLDLDGCGQSRSDFGPDCAGFGLFDHMLVGVGEVRSDDLHLGRSQPNVGSLSKFERIYTN